MLALGRSAVAAVPGARAFSTTMRTRYARITLIGHLAATPELEATSTGNELVRFSMASQHGPKDNRQTSWWRVTSFVSEGARRHLLTSLPKG
jgi:predicted secreted hydrolase